MFGFGESKPKPPFKEKFIDRFQTGEFARIKDFESNPRYVVKELYRLYDHMENILIDKSGLQKLEPNQLIALANQAKNIYLILKKYLGPNVAETHFVAGANQKEQNTVFFVQEKISGGTLKNQPPDVLKRFESSIDDLYVRMMDMALAEDISADPHPGNIMIGTRPGKDDPELVFVDTYPLRMDPVWAYQGYLITYRELTDDKKLVLPRFLEKIKEMGQKIKSQK
ncbi:MAG: hypothetical protein A2750_01645 [Candidatus Yanofskybacteria bacterium RIFCSPHIGHO2_01_FULL_45_42]|uniref:ABC1 atypical kinase-like domain-containing protein n=2 Tax=Candidatus Yanofskyibacteriota TaxID=1752733 RepID=A0A1F8F3V4_9BACT|nr:MAG: hypothetical protein A2750_01645 [Candidatus Yanofskybacteria bacterium RIFCSPHIGHO2_01_FULL_45_42]OGN25944.1 MAG: hypothetical protein A3B17_01390 [Candidatus Yanofskybacteria bacterium RIFCSPLOWO2_01_FULL_45_72]OGN31993.1 MAG: hypothetical protein A3J01_02865 [Candidatus Yanofskybacteria bacterium RIFCSPLOWO2_02_FULL_45_18]